MVDAEGAVDGFELLERRMISSNAWVLLADIYVMTPGVSKGFYCELRREFING